MRSSGVALLDEALGGLAPGFPLVLAGPTGSGRTVLCLQLAQERSQRGEEVVFLTGEPARLLLRQAVSMGLDLATPLREGRLSLLELDPDVASSARIHGGEALIAAIQQTAPAARLVLIDPLTALTSEILDEVALRSLVRAIFDRSAAARQVVIVTVDAELLRNDSMLERVLKEACGAFVELDRDPAGNHLLRVTKSRAAGCVSEPILFRIGAGGATRAASDPQRSPPADPPADRLTEPRKIAPPADILDRAIVRWDDVADADLSQEPPAKKPAQSAARPRVLIVEDDPIARDQMIEWLSAPYEVIAVEDGFMAVSAMLSHRPDLVVLDLHLPRVDGFEVLRTLRGGGASLPVLVVSGNLARAADRVRVLVLGATDLMRKPVQSFELIRKIETLLSLTERTSSTFDAADVEELLGGGGRTRVLEDAAFRERVGRACRFGERFGLKSTLVAVESPSTDTLDRFIAAAEHTFRIEDAMLLVGKRRALVLLVSTEQSLAAHVLKRFGAGQRSKASACTRGFRWRAVGAEFTLEGGAWDALFEDLEPWPGPEPRA